MNPPKILVPVILFSTASLESFIQSAGVYIFLFDPPP